MASGITTSSIQCPECKETVLFPVRARHLSNTEVAIEMDLAPVREHVHSHRPYFTTELPPTAL